MPRGYKLVLRRLQRPEDLLFVLCLVRLLPMQVLLRRFPLKGVVGVQEAYGVPERFEVSQLLCLRSCVVSWSTFRER
jgi:hypothetical protein